MIITPDLEYPIVCVNVRRKETIPEFWLVYNLFCSQCSEVKYNFFWQNIQHWPNIKERRKHKLKENEVDKIVNTMILSVLNITPNIHTQGFVFVIGNWNGVGGGGGELVKW